MNLVDTVIWAPDQAGLIYIHQAAGDLDEAADRIVCRSDPQLDELFLRILVVQQ